jgi:hypothetical protein
MMQGGAELVAEYKTASRGLVREVLAKSAGSPDRMISFTLPPRLKGASEGPVCLYVQLPANRRILPVRKAQGAGVDTARFRYPGWESGAEAQSAARTAQADVAALERQVENLDGVVRNRSAALTKRGWPVPASCDAIPAVKEAAVMTPPIGVLPPEKQDSAARQACINRMANSKILRDSNVDVAIKKSSTGMNEALESRLGNLSFLAGMGAQSGQMILRLEGTTDPQAAAVLQARQRDANAFLEDWRIYLPTLGPGFYPAIGTPDDYLELIGEAQATHKKLLIAENADRLGLAPDKRPVLTANEKLGLAGGMLDSYKGCVEDARSELKTKLAVWTELQRDSPERNRRIHEYYVNECRGLHEKLAAVTSERARIGTELADAQQRLASAKAKGGQNSAGGTQVLNEFRCD